MLEDEAIGARTQRPLGIRVVDLDRADGLAAENHVRRAR